MLTSLVSLQQGNVNGNMLILKKKIFISFERVEESGKMSLMIIVNVTKNRA